MELLNENLGIDDDGVEEEDGEVVCDGEAVHVGHLTGHECCYHLWLLDKAFKNNSTGGLTDGRMGRQTEGKKDGRMIDYQNILIHLITKPWMRKSKISIITDFEHSLK